VSTVPRRLSQGDAIGAGKTSFRSPLRRRCECARNPGASACFRPQISSVAKQIIMRCVWRLLETGRNQKMLCHKCGRSGRSTNMALEALQYSALYLASLRSIEGPYANTMINGSSSSISRCVKHLFEMVVFLGYRCSCEADLAYLQPLGDIEFTCQYRDKQHTVFQRSSSPLFDQQDIT
jgi:hypothetical protein